MTNKEQAFPTESSHQSSVDTYHCAGMTLRDYFAAKVDVSVYNPSETYEAYYGKMPSIEQLAEHTVMIRLAEADAMLKAREVYNDK